MLYIYKKKRGAIKVNATIKISFRVHVVSEARYKLPFRLKELSHNIIPNSNFTWSLLNHWLLIISDISLIFIVKVEGENIGISERSIKENGFSPCGKTKLMYIKGFKNI